MVDEIKSKFKSRDVQVTYEHQNAELKTKNKLLMEHAIEYVDSIKGNKGDLRKINKVKKHKGVILPYELLGTKGVTLTNCVKYDQEVSSVSWLTIEVHNRSSTLEGDIVNKSSIKIWSKFMQWLQHKKVRTIRDFKAASEL